MTDKATILTKKRPLFVGMLVLLQVLFVCGLAGSYYAAGWFGVEIRLKTVPVDPRDLLYGDYVVLGYEISRLDPGLWQEKSELPKNGDKVHVLLKPVNGLYEAAGVYSAKPAVKPGEVVLRGTVQYSWNQSIHVNYGLEKYYVPEGTGKELEDQARNMIVTVKVAPWGQAKIESLEPLD